ncbi:hypothetical protein F3K02_12515 [Hydrogenophaga sp. D2P1]|uniref:Uncharacterized protein n=1 Tax=Hydrogenophaga aromaticivorans TaxID=2610898 RepID=A0A7Y8GXY4_9BURK|nr:hypothetical protein [Hydrogenophaga aromaticivorans]NWF46068.1 hypothetical protein [Hydrogenophaga aromaticivorans]
MTMSFALQLMLPLMVVLAVLFIISLFHHGRLGRLSLVFATALLPLAYLEWVRPNSEFPPHMDQLILLGLSGMVVLVYVWNLIVERRLRADGQQDD